MSDTLRPIHLPIRYTDLAARIVRKTRTQVLTTKTNFTTIADKLGISRQTVSRKLDDDDMKLSFFLAAQLESNGDPVQTLADALADDNADWKEVETR